MMRKSIIAICCTSFLSVAALASDLDSQLMNIQQIEQQGKQQIELQQIEQAIIIKAKAEHDQKVRAARQAQLHKQKLLAAQKKAKAEEAVKSEQLADKYRDQAYQDQLRQLEIKRQLIALDKEGTRANRENDFIDAELKQKLMSRNQKRMQAPIFQREQKHYCKTLVKLRSTNQIIGLTKGQFNGINSHYFY